MGVGKKTATFRLLFLGQNFTFSLQASCKGWASSVHTPTLPSTLSCRLVAPPVRAPAPPSVEGRIESDDLLLDLRLDVFQVHTGGPECFSAS